MRLLAKVTIMLLLYSASLPAVAQSPREQAYHPLRTRTVTYRTIQYGVASWYGPGFRLRRTASGVPFDDRQLTAAHRSLPLGTNVKVTNLKNGRSVIVKVTDRGPWVRGRVIDLSRAAADRLGFRHQGVARVRIAVVRKPHNAQTQGGPPASIQGTSATESPQQGAKSR